ncbi:disulfide bond formation protein DsbB [Blochmannia endosymbiont of Camponotus modoc]|uniref:disulfide bond formation protein DsbB n=1 Tax=Blochmannia endosymbiont of Camponotus modoc TaxID=2945587 RepID=UPI002023C893|nr:disulfide bond formation protein DsbB [Blochmannia endosymbiont of Camponotus modoc]URJ26354.1 disulfide bond formation protein DsbB [Blochmannia endosymbiont of Camponotus modoc]URJ31607.1 disulfide bond formation protein DsbB [Blochmannia endosymbiont of Camponotus modoc]
MLNFLNICSKTRKSWVLLIFTVVILELIALYLQHIVLIKPCVLCVYQRCALCGIGIAGLVGTIAPFTPLRFFSIPIWIYSAWKGLLLAKEYTDIQLHPSPFLMCDLFVQFPHWLPLNKWWPSMFDADGNCAEYKWYFLSLEISQWMLIIFANYLIIAILVSLSQIIDLQKYNNK